MKSLLTFLKKILTSEYLSLILRIYIGWVFIDASLSKILDPALFAENVANYRLIPYNGLYLVAIILPWLELVGGFYLILGLRTKAAASVVGGLLFLFTVFVIINIFRGVNMNCGCFDTVDEPIGWTKVVTNMIWLSMTIQIFFFDKISFFRKGGFMFKKAGATPHFCFLTRRNILRVRRIPKRLIILVGVLVIFTLACSREEQFIGTYKSVPGTPPEFADLSLELKKGGEGIRRIHGKNHPFRWVVRGHHVRIHTESGGTIIAHAWGDRLLLRLPGPLHLYLKKIE